jgi:hypothetical protein
MSSADNFCRSCLEDLVSTSLGWNAVCAHKIFLFIFPSLSSPRVASVCHSAMNDCGQVWERESWGYKLMSFLKIIA